MRKVDDSIEKINEQIKKLSGDNIDDSKKKEKSFDDTTKVFEKIEDTDTKIFHGEETTTVFSGVEEGAKDSEDLIIKEEKIEENNEKNNKKRKTKLIICILIIFIVLVAGIVGGFLYFNSKNDDSSSEIVDSELTEKEKEALINNYGEALEGVINIYYSKQGVLLEYDDAVNLVDFEEVIKCGIHEIYSNGKVYLDKCSINGVLTKYSYGDKQEKVETGDDTLSVYVSKTNNIATLTKPKDESLYTKYVVHCGGIYSEPVLLSASGNYVFYYDSEYKIQMKNFKTDEKALASVNYQEVLPIKISEGYYDTTYLAVNINSFWGIYNIVNGSQVISPMYQGFVTATGISAFSVNSISSLGNNLIIAWGDDNYGVINYTNNKIVIPFDYGYMTVSGNYIWAKDREGKGYIYDTAGNKYLTEGYEELYGIINGIYVLVKQLGNVKMVKIDGKVLYDYGKIENMGNVNFGIDYDNNALFQFYDINSEGNCIEVLYDTSTNTGSLKNSVCGGIAKPVLYLYPKKKTQVSVSFQHPEFLETTYPKFTGEWKVEAYKDGSLYDESGKYYYALYWDEKKVHTVDFSEGFYVERDEAIEFLEEKLNYIGLTERERNEFIMYWLPVLEKNEKSLVYFELTEERESYNKINISPKPDSLLRVIIHVKRVNSKVDIKKQSLIKIQRKGFVAVEWGGTTY